jgi:hypothetical protein
LRGCLFIFSNPAHIKPHSIGTTFKGENIINTHLISFVRPLKVFVCAVTTTTQTKALRDGANGHPKRFYENDAMYHHLFQEEK